MKGAAPRFRGYVQAYAAPLALLATACTVPDLTFDEQSSSVAQSDAAAPVDAGVDMGRTRDAGVKRPIRSAKPSVAGAASGGSGNTGGNATGGMPAAASGGMPAPARAGSGGSAGEAQNAGGTSGATASNSMLPARDCAVWTRVNVRDNAPPAGAVEGGFETVTGVTNRQYVCRFRPPDSNYAIPGKYIVGLGCYVTYRHNGQPPDDASMLDGMIDVLTPAPGCSFSWRAATATQLPAGAADLGDPAGGHNYACHGDYSAVASSGKQIGTLITSSDTPPQYQCFFESFSNAIQPTDPTLFEVLVQD